MTRDGRAWRGAIVAVSTLAMLSGCAGPSSTPAPTVAPTPSPGMFVDAASDQGPISPLVYGSNDGPWLAVRFELQTQVQAAKLKTLTFPGGNYGDQYDLMPYQIDQFIDYCHQLGAEPRVVVRLMGGSSAAAADMVRYANVTKGYGVKYWGIGNEPDLYASGNPPDYDVAQYVKDWREYALAMRAVDPTIKLVGPDVSQFIANPTDSYMKARVDWLSGFLKADGDLVDIVSVHRYPYPHDAQTPATADDLRVGGREWDQSIPYLRSLIEAETGKDLPIAVTEINSSWVANSGSDGSMDSHMNAIWFASVLGHLIAQKVEMVDQFALAGQFGIVGTGAVNPIYYDYLMYQQFGTELVRSASDDQLVDVLAAKRADGTVTIMIVNLGASPATKPLTILGAGAPATAETWLFDSSHAAEKVAATPLSAGGSITVPGESVTVLVLSR